MATHVPSYNPPSVIDNWPTDGRIGGAWEPGTTRFPVTNPANGEIIANVANLGAGEVKAAIAAADAAWPAWRARTARDRGAILRRWYELVVGNTESLARLMTTEQGKPLAEARSEIAYAASFIEWYGEEGRRVYGETVPTADPAKRYTVIRQPIGICAAITPWNFPAATITRKIAPALAAGCVVIVKPAEQTPLTALAICELARQAGLPDGVLNILPADAANSVAIGEILCASDTVRHLSFTGSTEVGRILMAQCARTVKKLGLELGGNAPFIVFDDADLEAAVSGAMASKFRNAGQTCVCANRFYVQAGIHDRFVAALAAKMADEVVGNGCDPAVTQGPLIDDAALAKVEEHVADAVRLGAQIVAGGHRLSGRFHAPTLLTGAHREMLCIREETFGPVAPVVRFDTEEEVVTAANATSFGLASYFYTRDAARIVRVAEALEFGIVGVNTGTVSTAEVPFGGVKQSGLGREGSHYGIDEYLEAKYVCQSVI